ncbi:MAG TPA: alkaline phosphatase family protein [Chloroflexota bacterium]|nr:alkaline phosphatase family protein [Chloroflexota bacterium]
MEPFAAFLHAPISRRKLLSVVGSGVAAGLVGGALHWNPLARGKSLPYVVLIVLDGARPDYFGVPGTPNLQRLMRNGTHYTNAFAGILESETPSGHVTIATGSDPARTGIPSFWWANADNVQVSLFSPTKIRAGDMENLIRQARVPTLAAAVHAGNANAKVVALSGSKYYAADAIGGPDADITMYFQGTATGDFSPTYIPGHAPPGGLLTSPRLTTKSTHLSLGVENRLAMQLAVDTFNRVRQHVTLINLPEFDWPLGHVDGGIIDRAGVTTLMQSFDRDLGMLQSAYRKAGVLDNTLFVLMADHGMMPLRHRIAQSDLQNAVARAGTTLVSQTYTSATFLWVKDSGRIVAAAQNIARLLNPHIQSVYARLPAGSGYSYVRVTGPELLRAAGTEGANQYLLQSFNGPNAPDIVAVFAEGVGCEPGGQAGWKADHGGTSWQAQHIPLLLSGPGIRAGHVSSFPARLVDIAPTVLQAMGLPNPGMQGLALADALVRAPARAVQAQRSASRRLMPVVTSLQQESQRELAA